MIYFCLLYKWTKQTNMSEERRRLRETIREMKNARKPNNGSLNIGNEYTNNTNNGEKVESFRKQKEHGPKMRRKP